MPYNDARHRAKRWNERVKLVATLFNSVAIVSLAASLINPIANGHFDVLAEGGWTLLFGAGLAHMVGQYASSFIDAED